MRERLRGAVLAAAVTLATPALAEPVETATAVFAGGCFWCVEADFDKVPGVLSTVSGYTGGRTENPTYEKVTFGDTGHYEAVEIVYNPEVVTFETLVNHFFRTVDPTDAGGQFCDRGDSYRTAVFVATEEERAAAEAAKAEAGEILGEEIVTPILDAATFWKAEDYHQNYYQENPVRYRYYRWSCGRDQRIEALWGEAGKAS